MAAVGEREASGEGLSHSSLLEPGGQDTVLTSAASMDLLLSSALPQCPSLEAAKHSAAALRVNCVQTLVPLEMPVGGCHGAACEGRYEVRQLQIM